MKTKIDLLRLKRTYRVKFVYDEDGAHVLHDPEGNPLPGPQSVYEENPILRLIDPKSDPQKGKRRPATYAEYCQYEGNPDRHVVLGAYLEVLCPACGTWADAGQSLWGIDFMDDNPETECVDRVYTIPDRLDAIPGYLRDVTRELIAEAEYEGKKRKAATHV